MVRVFRFDVLESTTPQSRRKASGRRGTGLSDTVGFPDTGLSFRPTDGLIPNFVSLSPREGVEIHRVCYT